MVGDANRQPCQEPAFLEDLMRMSNALEAHFRDMCDIEFCIQHGSIYILNCRAGKRTGRAAIRIATDLLLEGVITGVDLLERISLRHLQDVLRPTLELGSQNDVIAKGLPASAGAATGVLVLNRDRARSTDFAGKSYIYAVGAASPEDAGIIANSAGLITSFGGMTSHGAVMCRGMAKPCVSGANVAIDRTLKVLQAGGRSLAEGSDITIDGTGGEVYSGRANIRAPSAYADERLCLLLRVIDVLAIEGLIPQHRMGHAWQLRDMLVHNIVTDECRPDVLTANQTRHEPIGAPVAFSPLKKGAAARLLAEMEQWHSASDHRLIWEGLRISLFRWLGRHVGVGRHYECYRPLFDPEQTIISERTSVQVPGDESRVQTIGEEFFNLNHYIPHCVEISTIRIYATVAYSEDGTHWRIDGTNPRGEKLREGSKNLLALKVIVNDALVALTDLPVLYNYIRKKEYFWGWYRGHGVTRHDIIHFLGGGDVTDSARDHLTTACRDAGLISSSGEVTDVGYSLLNKTTVIARRNVKICAGE